MKYLSFKEETDPAAKYEGLAKYAFDCEPWGGPGGIAHQNFYNFNFVPEINKEGVQSLHLILNALIDKSSGQIADEFLTLKESLSEEMKQRTGIDLINYIIEILSEQ